jgi:hypothetical protein
MNMMKPLRAWAICSTLGLLNACSLIQAVEPWEKGFLSRTEMTFDTDHLDAKYTEHVYFSKEAASGGSGVGGGGCGCN